jgi:2-keto-3-deoxy-6-phosphogluconate aldolase
MPKTPKGARRPADVISNAVHVMRIATGEIAERLTEDGKNAAAVALGRKGGLARANALSAKKKTRIATTAANARWAKQSHTRRGRPK